MSDEAQPEPVDAAFDYYFGGCDECGCPGTYVIHDEAHHYNVCEPCGTY